MKKAGLYNPYLDVMGGGERHVLSIMKALEDAGYQIHLFWDKPVDQLIEDRLNIHFDHSVEYLPSLQAEQLGVLQKLKLLSQFDIFIYVTNGSYFFSTAKQNIVFCMVPDPKLYQMNLMNQFKTGSYQFVCNSQFTQLFLQQWGMNASVIYPSIDQRFFTIGLQNLSKQPIILSVGRFFKHLHSKKQDLMITTFRKMKQQIPDLKKYRLVLAGSVNPQDEAYIDELKKLIGADEQIQLVTNSSFSELLQLYKQAEFFWHFAGYGIDDRKMPEKVEHLGITPLEAMAAGCITFCANAGGPKEIIQSGKNGFLFNTVDQLSDQMKQVISNPQTKKSMQENATNFVATHFRYEALQKRVWEVLEIQPEFSPPLHQQ